MKRDELVYLRHVLDAIQRIEKYIGGVDEEAFRGRTLIQDGVIRQLEIIGEAVEHLPAVVRDKYPDVPWQDIAGTRDKLIHHYFGVSLDEVWLMVQRDIPVLKVEVVAILGDPPASLSPEEAIIESPLSRVKMGDVESQRRLRIASIGCAVGLSIRS